MPFRFVHTADIHLDSPLRSLSLRNRELAELVGDATRQALVAIVDLCLGEGVDALLIAGDLYDGDQTSMKTARFLAAQMERLHQAGIAVFKIRGNHDALSKVTKELVLPPTVKVFGGRAEAVSVTETGRPIVIHGMSFAQPHAPDSLLPKFRPPVPDAINIGIMHTSLGGVAEHDVYAPCSLAELRSSGFRYWALGHIHRRSAHPGEVNVVMPGIPQGRDINEAGAKSVSLVTVMDDGEIVVEERLVGIAQFERVSVDLTGAESMRDVADAIGRALEAARMVARSDHLVARVHLSGTTPMSWLLHRDRDTVRVEAERQAERVGKTWVEKVEIGTGDRADRATVAGSGPAGELAALLRDETTANHGLREELRRLVKDLRDDLPPETRNFAGKDEAGFESFVETLLADAGNDVLARILASDGSNR